jgi:hypothetical protein
MEIELPFIPDRVDLLDFETGIGYRYEKKDPERSKRENLKKCVICECERPIKEVPNGVCNYCSEDSTFADQF